MQRQLHFQKWGCLSPAPLGCQRPCWNQPTSFHPPRNPSRISPTGIRSKFCSIGSVGGALDFLSLLFPLMVLDPGWSLETSLTGLRAIPNGRPLYQHWWLRSHEQKIFLYDLLVYLVTLGRSPSHFGLLLLLCTAKKSYWCLLLFKVKAKSISKHRSKEPWIPKRFLSAVPALFQGSSSSSEISGLRQCELTYLSGAHRACLVWECVSMLQM